jgi:hypothetical protein
MGFGAARSAPIPTMLVGALVDAAAAVTAKDADLLLLNVAASLSPEEVKLAREAAPDAVLGAFASRMDSAAVKALKEAGLDFLLVSESTPAAALLDDDLGYALDLPNQPEEIFLRSLAPLSFEALYLTKTPSPLTVAGQIELSRVASLAGKPLLTRADATANADELRCLRSVGVVGLMTDATGVAALKETVKSLPPRRGKREERAVVSLPHAAGVSHDDDDDDDD